MQEEMGKTCTAQNKALKKPQTGRYRSRRNRLNQNLCVVPVVLIISSDVTGTHGGMNSAQQETRVGHCFIPLQ